MLASSIMVVLHMMHHMHAMHCISYIILGHYLLDLPEFGHYAISPFCACANCDPAHFGGRSAVETRARGFARYYTRCVMYSWYVVVLFAKVIFL